MKITKWLATLVAFVVVIVMGMTLAGCKNNSDDEETCVVTYYPNAPEKATGAENLTPQKQTYPLGSIQQFPADLFSLAGYRIIGWSIDARATNVYSSGHRVGDGFTVHRDIDFYAIWETIGQVTIDGIIYVQRTDDEGNDYYEVWKASNKTDFVVANIRSEVAGIPVTSIGKDAFKGCSYLTSVSIPNTVTSVGTNAFNGCYKLTSVTIPDSVTKLGGGAFSNCRDLKSVAIPDSVECIDYSTFEYCSSLTSVSIPNSVTKIGKSAFSGCTNLTSVTIPDSVTEIGENAFYYCTNLTSIEIPGVVVYIRKGAFGCCSNLTEITLPWYYDDNEKFGYIFYYTEDQTDSKPNNSFVPQSLKKVTITGCNIGYSMFAECGGLTSVIIGDGVKSIKGQPFKGCFGLTTVKISDSVVSGIGYSVFKDCGNLTSVTIGDDNPVYSCQDKILYNKDKTSIICALETINGAVTIPNSVTSIGYRAFEGCSGLTNIEMPDSVTEIEEGAFSNCGSLTTISISNSVTKIGKDVFSNCSGLKSVTIPDSVTSIAAEAFNKCTGLKNVTYTGTLAQWCAMVDVSLLMQYAEHVYISDGNDLKSMTELVIPNVVTGINACAFYGCKNLASVTIPDSVKYISNSAFKDCKSLISIEISNGVTCIEESAFENCSELASVTIPNSVTSIENGAFRGCRSITEIQLPFTGASRNGTNNTYFDYIFGGTVSSIGSSAYNSLVPQTLKKVTITGNNIRDYAFRGCTSLTSVTILYGTASIGQGAFTNCKNLANVTIPNSVTGISTMAFYGCMGLKLINFGGTKAQWNSIKKGSYWDYSTGGIEGQVVGSFRGYTVACTDGNI